VERAERHNSDLPTSKNYMYSTYNIPAITYELGDETDRAIIRESASVYAQEMMKLLLEHH
ncbi:MAG: peptidase M14, partial [Pseudomonadota bacterium]